jgi:hypothetical protein
LSRAFEGTDLPEAIIFNRMAAEGKLFVSTGIGFVAITLLLGRVEI